jgi:hypothetical protein
MGHVSPRSGRFNFGEVARVRKCQKCIETKTASYKNELKSIYSPSRAIRVCISDGRSCCATGTGPNIAEQAIQLKLCRDLAWFSSFGLNTYLCGCGGKDHRVFDILFMEYNQLISLLKYNFTYFWPNRDFKGSIGRSLSVLHVGCFRFGIGNQDR